MTTTPDDVVGPTQDAAPVLPWAFDGAAAPAQSGEGTATTLVDATRFFAAGASGDVEPGRAEGLFVEDTRMLSCWRLVVDGHRLGALAAHQPEPFTATVLARVPAAPGQADSPLQVRRHRTLDVDLVETVTLRNHGPDRLRVSVRLLLAADFADLFEVKERRPSSRAAVPTVSWRGDGPPGSSLQWRAGTGERTVTVVAGGSGRADADGLEWQVELPPQGVWRTHLQVTTGTDRTARRYRPEGGAGVDVRALAPRSEHGAQVSTGDPVLARCLERSVDDLAALRIVDPAHPGRQVVAAGAPWFMALFGRDALLTAYMVLPFDADLALGTLQSLADSQGREVNAERDEQPGRIIHEMRFATAAPGSVARRYYGSDDATPLFVVVLAELARWTGITDAVHELLPAADRALAWTERFGDRDGDGFVEYARATEHGLVNQGWRDSWDGVPDSAGRPAVPPVALGDVQGYCYAARLARAYLADHTDDPVTARHHRAAAASLRARFDTAFRLPGRGGYALALDGAKHPAAVRTSDLGHLLWSGIVPERRAGTVAEILRADAIFSGWGLRTLAADEVAFNPVSYHNGSVWPHDNALCAAGLARHGFRADAERIVLAQLDAAAHFGHRLPELFAGIDRDDFPEPVPYPSACAPQAWASSAPLLHLLTVLGLRPDVPGGTLTVSPSVPERWLPLRVSGLAVGAGRIDVEVTADGWRCDGASAAGLRVTPGT